jgi:hypothetical protein
VVVSMPWSITMKIDAQGLKFRAEVSRVAYVASFTTAIASTSRRFE